MQIEKVQRRATRLATTLSDLPYTDHLSALNLLSLTYRHKRHNIIYLFQMMQGHIDINISHLFTLPTFSSTRGHNYKLFKLQSSCLSRSRFFAIQSINDWNSLSKMLTMLLLFLSLSSF